MQNNSRDSWADALFWGVTLAVLIILFGVPLALVFTMLGG